MTVNSVLPGSTPRRGSPPSTGSEPDARQLGIPAGFIGDPADFGQVVAFLCSEQARFITGVALTVDGGQDAALI